MEATRAFDPYGAQTAFFALVLCVVYGIDAFFKCKEWLVTGGVSHVPLISSGTVKFVCYFLLLYVSPIFVIILKIVLIQLMQHRIFCKNELYKLLSPPSTNQ